MTTQTLPDPIQMDKMNTNGNNNTNNTVGSGFANNMMPQQQETEKESSGWFWRPMLIGNRMRTTSEDSADTFDTFPAPGSMLDTDDDGTSFNRDRKLSISEMFLGSRGSNSGRRLSADSIEGAEGGEQRAPITENPQFKEFLRRQRHLVEDQA